MSQDGAAWLRLRLNEDAARYLDQRAPARCYLAPLEVHGMGILKEVRAAIGVGNLEVDVECDEELHAGDEVHGVATITGGQVPQLVQGLGLALTSRWKVRNEAGEEEDEGAKKVHRHSMPLHLEVAPGSVHRVPFAFDLPFDAPLAEPGDWYTIDVKADIPHAVDVTGSHRVTLHPPRPIGEALRAISSASGWSLDGYEPRKARPGFVRAVLSPGPDAAARFDRIYLEVAQEEGAFHVHATLDMHERFWRELTGTDKHHETFTAPDIAALVAGFKEMVDKHSAEH